MHKEDYTLLRLVEGQTVNYFEALMKTFGGKIEGNTYLLDEPGTSIQLAYYSVLPDFEILTSDALHNKPLIIERASDNDPDYIHLYVINQGHLTQSYSESLKLIEADSSKGVFMYNGLFPMTIKSPANRPLKSVAYKFSKSALLKLIPEAEQTFNTLFGDKEPIAYHTNLPAEMINLITDLFAFNNSKYGKIPLVLARSLELFTLLMKSIKKLTDKDELHGLHIEDYQRLQLIQKKLLSSFDQRITIEELANDFNISTSKLKRDFKTLHDCSVYQFYTSAKMDEAYHRLQSGKYSVTEVGYDLGYNSIPKFSQMFKKVKGINPSDVISLQ